MEAESESGARGFGEGCPREYVTGETVATALEFVRRVQPDVLRIGSLGELRAWVDAQRDLIDANPSAWCAVELALLDVLARDAGRSVEDLLSLPSISGPFRYSAVLGAEEPNTFKANLQRFRSMDFRDFKVKLCGNPETDSARMAILAADKESIDALRFDANNLWKDPQAALDYLRKLETPFFAVEEPLAPRRYAELGVLADSLPARIILDESFLQLAQFDHLKFHPGRWILNLRISKLGGLLRSLAVMERAHAEGIPFIVGCQVGETSVLTRAALTLAQASQHRGLTAQEGAFGTHLLQRDVIKNPLMFGAEGRLEVIDRDFPRQPGFGLNPEHFDDSDWLE
ncbi:MAG: putative Muconate cycloisomerase [Verrucomicrobia bacterium]|nr:putative Muconate cycloisomerase [Verrucomicrobiota bacterium]